MSYKDTEDRVKHSKIAKKMTDDITDYLRKQNAEYRDILCALGVVRDRVIEQMDMNTFK